jgi:hypothetical protein
MVKQGHSSANAVAILRTILRDRQQRIDGLSRCGLDPRNGIFDQLAPRLTVCGAELGRPKPSPERSLTYAGLTCSRSHSGSGQKGRDRGFFLAGQFLAVSGHLRLPAVYRLNAHTPFHSNGLA